MDSVAARSLAFSVVGNLMPRWQHVRSVGQRAEALAERHPAVDEELVVAAWLHDVGYAPRLRDSGQHSIDGAEFLLAHNCSVNVVRLVAYHTGAAFEAAERGLTANLAAFDPPRPHDLDVLTMIDLSVGPDGSSVLDTNRLVEILKRYSEQDPVHRAVTRAKSDLLSASARAKRLLGLPDDWPVVAC